MKQSHYVSFDLDGTLVKTTFADKVWLEGLPWVFAREKNIAYDEAKHKLLHQYDEVGDEQPEWYDIQYWYDRFQLSSSWQELLAEYRDSIELYDDAKPVVERLAENHELIIVSNAKREFIDIQLTETSLDRFFTQVFSSTSDFHQVKKTTDFYAMICSELDISPSKFFHVGDHYRFDYAVPQSLGVRAFLLDRTNNEEGQCVVHSLQEFEKHVSRFVG